MIVATWMYSPPPGEQHLHFQTGAASDRPRVRDLYWRCIFCLFASSTRHNGHPRHVLLCNTPPPERIDKIATAALIARHRIEIQHLADCTVPPPDYHPAWRTQFVVLDALDRLAALAAADEAVLLLDGDSLFNRAVDDDLLADLARERALCYTLDYPPHQPINGLNAVALRELSHDLDPTLAMDRFHYHGGEFLCLRGDQLRPVASAARRVYAACLERHARGQPKFTEEAQLLSFVFHCRGYRSHTANRFVKRIWTDRSTFCNATAADRDLTVWHLPAEKHRGFVAAFGRLTPANDHGLPPGLDPARLFRVEVSAGQHLVAHLRRALRPLYLRIRRPS